MPKWVRAWDWVRPWAKKKVQLTTGGRGTTWRVLVTAKHYTTGQLKTVEGWAEYPANKSDAEAHALQDYGQCARQSHDRGYLTVASSKRSHHFDQRSVGVFYAGQGVDANGEKGK